MKKIKKINVLYFIPCFGLGGTEKIVSDLCSHLDPDKFVLNVCVFVSGEFENKLREGQRILTLVKEDGSPRHIIGKFINFVDRIKHLNKILQEESVDILHTHHLSPFLHALLASRRKKGVRWVHTEHIRPDIERAYARSGVRIFNNFIKYADGVTGVSEAVGTYFRHKSTISKDKIYTILNGVDVNKFNNADKRTITRSEIGFTDDTLVIGVIGSLRKQKNHQNLIKAFSIILPRLTNVRLMIVGDGECIEELKKLVSVLSIVDYVHFLGYRLDTAELMSAIDIYCLPSFFEGMPLSAIEAWAAGKPVVATDVIGIKEMVKHEVNGILVPSDDSDKLADGLIRVITDSSLRETIARNGQKFAMENCTVEHMVKQYADIYLELMNSK